MNIKRVLFLLLALVLSVVPVIFVNNAISYIPFISLLIGVGASYGYLVLLAKAFDYSEDSMLPSCERGSNIEFAVTFTNKSFLVFPRVESYFYVSDLFGNIDKLLHTSLVLAPREETEFNFGARFDHLGVYSAGVQKVVIYDLLGLFSRTLENSNRHEVTVLPRVYDLADVDLSDTSVTESNKASQPIVTDDMDYSGVREYAPGDPLKTIHWKLSSRNVNDQYYTRLFETLGNPGISIVVDTTSPEYDSESLMQVFDAMIESALSLNVYAQSRGIDSEVLYIDQNSEVDTLYSSSGKAAFKLISRVPRVVVGENDESVLLLKQTVNNIHGKGNVAFITAHVTEETITTLMEAKMRKRNPLLFVVVPRSLDGQEKSEFLAPLRRLDSSQIAHYTVSSSGESLEVN